MGPGLQARPTGANPDEDVHPVRGAARDLLRRRGVRSGRDHVRRTARSCVLQRQTHAGPSFCRRRDGAVADEGRPGAAEPSAGARAFRVRGRLRPRLAGRAGRRAAWTWRGAPRPVGRDVVRQDGRHVDRRVHREASTRAGDLQANDSDGRWRERGLHRERAREPARFRSSDQLGRARHHRRPVPRAGKDCDRDVSQPRPDALVRVRSGGAAGPPQPG